MKGTTLLLSVLLAACSHGTQVAPQSQPTVASPIATRIEQEVAAALKQSPIASVSVAVVHRGQPLLTRAWMTQIEGQPGFPLLKQRAHVFAIDEPRVTITFDVQGDRATGLTIEQGGMTIQARRVAR